MPFFYLASGLGVLSDNLIDPVLLVVKGDPHFHGQIHLLQRLLCLFLCRAQEVGDLNFLRLPHILQELKGKAACWNRQNYGQNYSAQLRLIDHDFLFLLAAGTVFRTCAVFLPLLHVLIFPFQSRRHAPCLCRRMVIHQIQRRNHLIRCLVPVDLIFCRCLHNDSFHIRRYGRIDLRRRQNILVHVHDSHCHRIVRIEGNLPRQHFIQHDSQRIDVGFFVHIAASGLFRRKVVHRSHDGSGLVGRYRRCADGFGNAKIRDLRYAVGGNQYIVRLDIPVDDLIFMG